jgi:Protein of unknown function (DUF2752)
MTAFDAQPHVHVEGDACGAPAPNRKSGIAWLLSSPIRVVGLGAAAALAIDAGGTDGGPGLCIFRRATGGYCPGCGLTRSARHLMQGELAAAWHDHPWLLLAVGQAMLVGAIWGILRSTGRHLNVQRIMPPVGMINAVLLFGIWIARLVDGSIPRFY